MPFPSYFHLVFEMMAYFIGFRYFLRLRKLQPDPITENHRVWIFLGACAGALLGSRILGALEDLNAWKASAHPLVYLYASKTMVGGLLGGLAGVEITKKFLGEKRSSGDLFTYPLILGIIIGRIGCFLSGINEPTYGYVTSAWTGMDLGDGLKRHPIALYEILFLLTLWITLRQLEKNRPLLEGFRFQNFMIA
jgi:prolipoprotein diacylglyceryltransferase